MFMDATSLNAVGSNSAIDRRKADERGNEIRPPSTNCGVESGGSTFYSMPDEHGFRSIYPFATESEMLYVDKECFIERLVLEEVIASVFTRCLLFIVSFICLVTMMWLSFPAHAFFPVHQSIVEGFDLTGSFQSISTLEDIQSYLTEAASMSRKFSPVSATYLDDIQSKSFIHSPQTFPPIKQLGHAQFPTLTANFTITVWVKTRVRLDTIIRKQSNDLTCWSWGPERVIYGEHDSYHSESVVHPWAQSMYRPGVERANAWKSSKIGEKVSDNKWHHLGVRVNDSSIDFVYDGVVVRGTSQLSRPVTDCPGGNVIIGSERFVAEMSDLVFFNRFLNDLELDETFVTGRPIDVLLSGSGPKPSTEEFTLEQQLAEMEAATSRRFRDLEDKVQLGQRGVVLEMETLKNNFSSNPAAGHNEEASPTSDGQTTVKEHSDQATLYFQEEKKSCFDRILRDTLTELEHRSLYTLKNILKNEPNLSLPRNDNEFDDLLTKATHSFASCIRKNKWTPSKLMSMTAESAKRDCAQTQTIRGDLGNPRGMFVMLRFVRNTLLLVEQTNCRAERAYRTACPHTCGLPVSPHTSPEPNHESKKVDENDYRDAWGRDCEWYQLNDKTCEIYASDKTKHHCRKTCSSDAFDRTKLMAQEGAILNVEKLNARLLHANQNHMILTRNMARNYVAYYCCLRKHYHNEPDDATWKKQKNNQECDALRPSWHKRYLGENLCDGLHPQFHASLTKDYKECFPNSGTLPANIGFPIKWLVDSDAQNIIAHIFKDAISTVAPRHEPRIVSMSMSDRFPNHTRTVDTKVELFADERRLDDTFSLTMETHKWRWKACSGHADCTGLAFACAPEHYTSGFCKTLLDDELWPQKQFCSSTCFTGGCDDREERVCQPCDACVGNDCTGPCGKIEEHTDFSSSGISDQIDWYGPMRTEVQTNTYSISAWVKDFGFQRLLEKRVNVTLPPSYVNSEKYDAATGTLVCYYLSYSKFCYRTYWYDKTMTCIPNPLSSLLQDDKWHHLAMVKSAFEETFNTFSEDGVQFTTRVDDFKFFVDGKEGSSSVYTTSQDDSFSTIFPYGAADCGGPMVSTVELSAAGEDSTLGKDTGVLAHAVQQATQMNFNHFLPFGDSAVVLQFDGLGVPKGAVIKQAYLEFSAVQNPAQHAIENAKCGTQKRTSAHVPEKLEISSFSGNLLQEQCALRVNQASCINVSSCNEDKTSCLNLCYWDEESSRCAGGVSIACFEFWSADLQRQGTNGEDRARPVAWEVDIEEWRKTNLHAATIKNGTHDAYESLPYDAGTQSDALRLSPNVSTLIKDILSDPLYDPKTSSATFIIRKSTHKSDENSARNMCFDTLHYDADRDDSTCNTLQNLSGFIDTHFPFLALSKEGASKAQSGSAPRLRIYWCYTDDCISPIFAGTGDDVKNGKSSLGVPSNKSWLKPAPRITYDATHVEDSLTVPKYNGVPYMVLGAALTRNQDPLLQGKMFDLRTMPRSMTLSDVQQMYYANIRTVPDLPGPSHVIDAQSDESQLHALEFTKEVISIAPPVLLQTRNKVVPCANIVPALAPAMKNYFDLHIKKKCHRGPYTCQFPTVAGGAQRDVEDAFSCVDRAQYVKNDTYFERARVEFGESEYFFPEFLELMNLRTVYRDSKMLAAKKWADMASSTIILVGVFLAPSDRLGTVMQLKIENGGAGKIESSFSLSSFKQMSSTEQILCILFVCIISVCCFIEIYFIISLWALRSRDKKKWMCLALACRKMRTEDIKIHFANMNAAEQEELDYQESRRLERRMKLIAKNCPVFDFWDLFDMVLRVVMLVLVMVYMTTYYSSALHSRKEKEQLGRMEKYLETILKLDWHNQHENVHSKVQAFAIQIGEIVSAVNHLLQLRIFCVLLVLVCMFRLIVYMRVHPRVAILYKTVATSIDDLFHFALTFSFLYFALAFTATWTFGAVDERYSTFGASCYSQFNMIIGEYPMDPVVELQSLYVAYLFVFCVVMFLIIMNFFLAILIDSYSAVKDQVNECRVAQNFLADVYFTLKFHYYQWVHQWPSRWQLIDMLLRADIDGDGLNDEAQSFSVSVMPLNLVEQEIVYDLDSATALLKHYLDFSPDLAGFKKDNKNNLPVLEHHIVLKRLLQLDLVSHDLRGLHREVHPLGRRSEETKVLINQLVHTGHKIVNALRINKTQFRTDLLLQEDGMTDGMITRRMSRS